MTPNCTVIIAHFIFKMGGGGGGSEGANFRHKKIQCEVIKGFLAPKSPDFEDFILFFLKLPCLDNRFQQVTKIQ